MITQFTYKRKLRTIQATFFVDLEREVAELSIFDGAHSLASKKFDLRKWPELRSEAGCSAFLQAASEMKPEGVH